MEMLPPLVAICATLWIVLVGVGFMIAGPKGAAKVNHWIIRQVRKAISGLFIAIGNLFKP